jgi:uncharacterized protein HemX
MGAMLNRLLTDAFRWLARNPRARNMVVQHAARAVVSELRPHVKSWLDAFADARREKEASLRRARLDQLRGQLVVMDIPDLLQILELLESEPDFSVRAEWIALVRARLEALRAGAGS